MASMKSLASGGGLLLALGLGIGAAVGLGVGALLFAGAAPEVRTQTIYVTDSKPAAPAPVRAAAGPPASSPAPSPAPEEPPATTALSGDNRDALRAQLRGARFLLQPGVEDVGIAAVEALACGTPVVALGRGGVLDVVEDGVHGVLCEDPREPGAQAAALAAGIDKCARIGWNTEDLRGRAEGFSFKRFIDRFRALLAERVPGRGTSGLGERSV